MSKGILVSFMSMVVSFKGIYSFETVEIIISNNTHTKQGTLKITLRNLGRVKSILHHKIIVCTFFCTNGLFI